MKLAGQQYVAVLDDGVVAPCDESRAEVRTWNDKWVGDARITAKTLGEYDTKPEACRALAMALRELADKVES